MSKKRKASEENAVSLTQDMTHKPPSITCQVSETRMDLTSNGIHTGELGPFEIMPVEIDTRAQETEVRLKQTEIKLKETFARASMTDTKLKDAETKAHVTEVRLKEVEEKVRNVKEMLSKTDLLAAKAHVKACKLEVKLKDSEARAQKAEAHVIMAEKIKKLERELIEAEITVHRTEENHKECEAKAKKVLENLADSKEKSHLLEVQLSEAEKRAHIAEAKQIEMEVEAQNFRIKWIEAEEKAKHADDTRKETDFKLSDITEKLKEKEAKLSETELKYYGTEQKLAETQARAQKTELNLTEADKSSCNLDARLKEILGRLNELRKTANKASSGQFFNVVNITTKSDDAEVSKSLSKALAWEEQLKKALKEKEAELAAAQNNNEVRKVAYLQRFLRSEAFRYSTVAACNGILKKAIYLLYEDLAKAYPVLPEEIGVRNYSKDEIAIPSDYLSECTWDEDKDRLIDSKGKSVEAKFNRRSATPTGIHHPFPRSMWPKDFPRPPPGTSPGSSAPPKRAAAPSDGKEP